jgi:hypothetical protein
MPNIFNMDKKSQQQLLKFARKFPKEFQFSSASILTSQAFELRKSITHTLQDEFEIRNKRFMNSSVRVQKASKSQKIDKQVSWAGSVHKNRFSGWIEQELGISSDTDRVQTEDSRKGGSYAGQVRPKYRMNKAGGFKRAGEFSSKRNKTKRQQTIAMINAAKKSKKPFIVDKDSGISQLEAGVYDFIGKNLRRVQTFGQPWKPKRTRWMEKSLNRLDRTFNLKNAWGKELTFRMKKLGAR